MKLKRGGIGAGLYYTLHHLLRHTRIIWLIAHTYRSLAHNIPKRWIKYPVTILLLVTAAFIVGIIWLLITIISNRQ